MKNVSAEYKITAPKKWGEKEFKQYTDLFKQTTSLWSRLTSPSSWSRLTSLSSVNPIPLLEAILVYVCDHAGSDTVKSFLRDEPSLRKPEFIGIYPPYCQQLIYKLQVVSLDEPLQSCTYNLLVNLLYLTDMSPGLEEALKLRLLIMGDIKSAACSKDQMEKIFDYFMKRSRENNSLRSDLFFLYFIVYSNRYQSLIYYFNKSSEGLTLLKEIANCIISSSNFFSLCNFSEFKDMISRKIQVINVPNPYHLKSTYELTPDYLIFLDLLHELYNPFAAHIARLVNEEQKINQLLIRYTSLPLDIINLIVEGYYTSGVKKFFDDNHLEVKQPTEYKFATLYKFSSQIPRIAGDQNYVTQLMKSIKDPCHWDEDDFARHKEVFEQTDCLDTKKILFKSMLVYGCGYARGETVREKVLLCLEISRGFLDRLKSAERLYFCQNLIDQILTPPDDQTKEYKHQLLFLILHGTDSDIFFSQRKFKIPEILELWLLALGDERLHFTESHPRTIWVNHKILNSAELIFYFDDPKTHPGGWLKNLFLIFTVYADRYPAHCFIINEGTDNSMHISCGTIKMPLKSITKIIAGLSEGISLSDFAELPLSISREHKEIHYPNDCKLKSTYRLSDNCLTFLNLLKKQNPFGSAKDRLIDEEQKIGELVQSSVYTPTVITSLIMQYHSNAKKFFEEADQKEEKQSTPICH